LIGPSTPLTKFAIFTFVIESWKFCHSFFCKEKQIQAVKKK